MDNSSEESKGLAVEKQKTLRLLITVSALFVLALIGFFIVLKGTEKGGEGKVDLDLRGGKLSLTLKKPIIDQINQDTSTVRGGGEQIRFTKGIIRDQTVIDQISRLEPAGPNSFSGRNFISNDLHFLFSVQNPARWQIQYNSAGLQNAMIPVYRVYNPEGASLNIGVGPVLPGMNIQQYVEFSVGVMLQAGAIRQVPLVTYDLPSETAFAIFTNSQTMGQSYQKVIINRGRNQVFVASANYNQALSSPADVRDLLNMIATFTLF
ncbi:MAG TPA: hypothetical protein VMB78_09275 [Dissulfurispiraceae bacterium]|nr:hypothetical protein [Dissulfurispiraceae bacterium]